MAAPADRTRGYKIWLPGGPPPLPLIWAWLPAGGTAAARLHKIYLRAVWRSRTPQGLLRMLCMLCLWPILTAHEVYQHTRDNAATVTRLTGKGARRQAVEQFWFCGRHGFRAWNYYTMELYLPERRALAGAYLHRYEMKGGLYDMLRGNAESPLKNKVTFAEYCLGAGLPVTPILATFVDGATTVPGIALPQTDLFIKRRNGRGGKHSYLMRYEGGRYHGNDGVSYDHDSLVTYLGQLSRAEPYIVQPRERNHPAIADLSPQALASLRVVTAFDERGDIEVVRAVFRMGPLADSIVDNFHAGGIAAPVELATGKLGPATDYGLEPGIGWLDRHPATGAVITGRVIPQWPEIVALACRAHGHFRDRLILGWDIALTPAGLLIVEGNSAADVDNIQRPHQAPLGLSRFAQLALWHIESRLGRDFAG